MAHTLESLIINLFALSDFLLLGRVGTARMFGLCCINEDFVLNSRGCYFWLPENSIPQKFNIQRCFLATNSKHAMADQKADHGSTIWLKLIHFDGQSKAKSKNRNTSDMLTGPKLHYFFILGLDQRDYPLFQNE